MLFYGGMTLGDILMPIFSDRCGRKLITIASCLIQVGAGVALIFNTNKTIALYILFIQGFGCTGRMIVGYIWMMENMRAKDLPAATGIAFALNHTCIIISSIYFLLISNDWRFIYGAPLAILFIGAIIMTT